MTLDGWILDCAVIGNKAVLWIKTDDGRSIRLSEEYHPEFYMTFEGGNGCDGRRTENSEQEAEMAAESISQHPLVFSATVEQRYPNVRSSEKSAVVRVAVQDASGFRQVIADMKKVPGRKEIAEASMPHYFKYMVTRGLDFFTKYRMKTIETNGAGGKCGRLESFEPLDPEEIPRLKVCALAQKDSFGYNGKNLRILCNGENSVIAKDELASFARKNCIDVACTSGGDNFLGNKKMEVEENRGPHWHGHSFGIRSSTIGSFIEGCIHLDLSSDFGVDIYAEMETDGDGDAGLEGLLKMGRERLLRVVELSRISGAKPDFVSRVSPGRLNTYIHYREAKRQGYVVPDAKRGVERPKTLRRLLSMDKGGVIIYPQPGAYENVGKLDFASMYPSVIVNCNISPETMDCECTDCRNGSTIDIPGTGWKSCAKRKGIIPAGIEKVLRRRLLLKGLMRTEKDPTKKRAFDVRQKALKNILVTCFGYLGFNNFVFSNVECKEATVCAGREYLARTKAMAEEAGLDVLYGIVDSVFVAGGDKTGYEAFSKKVTNEIGIGLELDCIFARIAFPEAAQGGSAANRYYGITADGEIEARGIGIRRRDSCGLVNDFQQKAIRILLSREDDAMGKAERMLEDILQTLKEGRAPIEDLIISKSMSKAVEEYKVRVAHVQAYEQAPTKDGVARFVFTMQGPKPVDSARGLMPDAGRYAHLLSSSLEELARGLGLKPRAQIFSTVAP